MLTAYNVPSSGPWYRSGGSGGARWSDSRTGFGNGLLLHPPFCGMLQTVPSKLCPCIDKEKQLEKRTTWKHIKDFLRDDKDVQNVDNVHVFRDRTGWVRVFGKPDFDKAMCTSMNPLPCFT